MKSQTEQITEYQKWMNIVPKTWTSRMDIINHLIRKNSYKKYLEIGVRNGQCIAAINAEHKDGVDPVPSRHTNYQITSDDFFANLNKDYKYDIIFIDGLHYDYQVYKDIKNSLEHLAENGIIICHDMNPPFEICQRREVVVGSWNGDSWKAFVQLRTEREDLTMFTIDTDWGLGVIKRGKQSLLKIEEPLTYEYMDKNRKELLNLITVEEFYKK